MISALEAVTAGSATGDPGGEILEAVWRLAGFGSRHGWADPAEAAGGVPHVLEPWFCCAEPPAVRLGAPAAALNRASSVSDAFRAVASLRTVAWSAVD